MSTQAYLEGTAVSKNNGRHIGPSSDPEMLITIPEARQIVPLSEPTYRRKLSRGELRKFKAGSRTLVKLRDVLALAREA